MFDKLNTTRNKFFAFVGVLIGSIVYFDSQDTRGPEQKSSQKATVDDDLPVITETPTRIDIGPSPLSGLISLPYEEFVDSATLDHFIKGQLLEAILNPGENKYIKKFDISSTIWSELVAEYRQEILQSIKDYEEQKGSLENLKMFGMFVDPLDIGHKETSILKAEPKYGSDCIFFVY